MAVVSIDDNVADCFQVDCHLSFRVYASTHMDFLLPTFNLLQTLAHVARITTSPQICGCQNT
jgi:hypothetical protein